MAIIGEMRKKRKTEKGSADETPTEEFTPERMAEIRKLRELRKKAEEFRKKEEKENEILGFDPSVWKK